MFHGQNRPKVPVSTNRLLPFRNSLLRMIMGPVCSLSKREDSACLGVQTAGYGDVGRCRPLPTAGVSELQT